jgi:hypothetical protein
MVRARLGKIKYNQEITARPSLTDGHLDTCPIGQMN